MSRSAVFLDRDDTVIRDKAYLSDPEGVELLPGAPEAIRLLNEAGIPAILVTNQSGVARGFFDEDRVDAIHLRLMSMLSDQGARLDAVYYCPHLPGGAVPEYAVTCSCRKPAPGLLLQAALDFGLDLTTCFMIGDKPEDVLTIHGVGGKGILIETGKPLGGIKPDFTTRTLLEAVQWILGAMEK